MNHLLYFSTSICNIKKKVSNLLNDHDSESLLTYHPHPKNLFCTLAWTQVWSHKSQTLATLRSRDFHQSDPGFSQFLISLTTIQAHQNIVLAQWAITITFHSCIYSIDHSSFQDSTHVPSLNTIFRTRSGLRWKSEVWKNKTFKLHFCSDIDEYIENLEGRILAQSAYSDLRAVTSLVDFQLSLSVTNDCLSQNLNYLFVTILDTFTA